MFNKLEYVLKIIIRTPFLAFGASLLSRTDSHFMVSKEVVFLGFGNELSEIMQESLL